MNTQDTTRPTRNPVWIGIGAVFFVLVMAVLFFIFASTRMRHALDKDVPPAGTEPARPGPIVPH